MLQFVIVFSVQCFSWLLVVAKGYILDGTWWQSKSSNLQFNKSQFWNQLLCVSETGTEKLVKKADQDYRRPLKTPKLMANILSVSITAILLTPTVLQWLMKVDGYAVLRCVHQYLQVWEKNCLLSFEGLIGVKLLWKNQSCITLIFWLFQAFDSYWHKKQTLQQYYSL